MRRHILLALLALGALALGFAGCERRIVANDRTPRWIPPPPPPPATSIRVQISGAVAELEGLQVSLSSGGVLLKQRTLTGVTASPVTITFDSLGGIGTYLLGIMHTTRTDILLQTSVVSITNEIVPLARLTVKKIENTSTIKVETAPVVQNTTTTVTVTQPPAVQEFASTAASAQVIIPPNSGISNVTVSTQTGTEVPPIITNNVVSQSVIGAVQIQADVAAPNTPVTVKIPLPINSNQFAQASGGSVTLFKFDLNTQTWTSLGQATIGADGTVTANLTGLDKNTLVSIGSTPQVAQSAQQTESALLSPQQVDQLRRQGSTTYTYNQSPSVTVSKPARSGDGPYVAKGTIIPAPPGIQSWQWSTAAPIIAQRVPELRPWIYSGETNAQVALGALAAEIRNLKINQSFTFNYKFGNVTMAFTVRISYNKAVLIEITHTSGGT